MEQETIAQTMLDQLVTDENSQMLKALIPYLSFSGQRILAAYAKTQELCNTLQFGIFDDRSKLREAAEALRDSHLAKTVFATQIYNKK